MPPTHNILGHVIEIIANIETDYQVSYRHTALVLQSLNKQILEQYWIRTQSKATGRPSALVLMSIWFHMGYFEIISHSLEFLLTHMHEIDKDKTCILTTWQTPVSV